MHTWIGGEMHRCRNIEASCGAAGMHQDSAASRRHTSHRSHESGDAAGHVPTVLDCSKHTCHTELHAMHGHICQSMRPASETLHQDRPRHPLHLWVWAHDAITAQLYQVTCLQASRQTVVACDACMLYILGSMVTACVAKVHETPCQVAQLVHRDASCEV